VAYGSVPIFIPQLWPHSYYNARYGMEMLPALALFMCIAAAMAEMRLNRTRGEKAVRARWLVAAMLAFAVLNPIAMVYGTSLVRQCASLIERHPSNLMASYSPPLVLKEALVNASTRVPFERNLAVVLEDFPPGEPILMAESDHIGALQDAGIPLKQTINESDYDSWHAALADPANHAAFVIAIAGDDVSKAVAAHPEGLSEVSILCTTGQPCARIYQSERYKTPGVPMTK
jgi:hypothetical protein